MELTVSTPMCACPLCAVAPWDRAPTRPRDHPTEHSFVVASTPSAWITPCRASGLVRWLLRIAVHNSQKLTIVITSFLHAVGCSLCWIHKAHKECSFGTRGHCSAAVDVNRERSHSAITFGARRGTAKLDVPGHGGGQNRFFATAQGRGMAPGGKARRLRLRATLEAVLRWEELAHAQQSAEGKTCKASYVLAPP